MEVWKPITVDPRYEISQFGNVRKKNPKNGYRKIKVFRKWNTNLWVININNKEVIIAREVANAFVKQLVKGDIVLHKNKLENDNYYKNLIVVDKKYAGMKTGHLAGARAVVEVKDGEIVRRWRSGRQAEKELFISRQTVSDYCNNKVKRKMFNLMWEDDYFDMVFPPFKWERRKRKI